MLIQSTSIAEKLILLFILTTLSIGIGDNVKIQNGVLILKLNDKKKTDMSINIDEELRKLIKFETNKQLNIFSRIYYTKIKNKLNINE